MAKNKDRAQKQRFGNQKASHLVVLIHGLWGQPSHMHTIAEKLEERHGESVRILIPSTNKLYNTYDGIEVGGERVAAEIESELAAARTSGHPIRQFSVVGYSLGGLIARYCIGLLYARGCFDPARRRRHYLNAAEASSSDQDGSDLDEADDLSIEPVSFTTIASPWVGVQSPVRFLGINLWNFLGSRVLSTSGQQMFLTDRFRDLGRPLLVVMADPSSIFMKALACFRRRTIYSNIVSDKSVPFWTSCVVAQDPFLHSQRVTERLDFSYVSGYAPTILDINKPVVRANGSHERDIYSTVISTMYTWLTRLPLFVVFIALFPLTGTLFFANAGVQTIRSGARIRSHEGLGTFADYRVPLLLEQALEAASGGPETIDTDDDHDDDDRDNASLLNTKANGTPDPSFTKQQQQVIQKREAIAKQSGLISDVAPRNFAPEQYEIIENVNRLGIRKFPVHISLVGHSHAAIIVRWKKDGFREGYTVIKHWLDEEFMVE